MQNRYYIYEFHRLLLILSGKVNLKKSDKYVNIKSHTKSINLKYQLPRETRNLNYLMDQILHEIFKIKSSKTLYSD